MWGEQTEPAQCVIPFIGASSEEGGGGGAWTPGCGAERGRLPASGRLDCSVGGQWINLNERSLEVTVLGACINSACVKLL